MVVASGMRAFVGKTDRTTSLSRSGKGAPKRKNKNMAPAASVWLLRHGRSKANEAGVVVSALAHGTLPEYGLSAHGQAQARAAGWELAAQGPAALAVLASPFARTLETAALAAAELAPGCFADGKAAADLLDADGPPDTWAPPPPRVRAALRERGFGAFELGPAEEAYRQVRRPRPQGSGAEWTARCCLDVAGRSPWPWPWSWSCLWSISPAAAADTHTHEHTHTRARARSPSRRG